MVASNCRNVATGAIRVGDSGIGLISRAAEADVFKEPDLDRLISVTLVAKFEPISSGRSVSHGLLLGLPLVSLEQSQARPGLRPQAPPRPRLYQEPTLLPIS
jgi:hypothetical protein